MIQIIWYHLMKTYVKIAMFFLMKKVRVFGKENIPKKGAVLFIPNHQNALIDAILIPLTNSRNTHFLTRAAVFGNKYISKFLHSLNMLPVYRIRDGFKTIGKNIAIFEKCFEILQHQKAIEIFAEGEHHIERRIITLKKGYARIILGTLQQNSDLEIKIIPVGINYDSHLNYPSSASIYYGKPIIANDYINTKNPDVTFKELTKKLAAEMKKLTLHVDENANYDAIIKKLEANHVNYLNPVEAKQMLQNIDNLPNISNEKRKINWFVPLHFLAKLNSIFPLLIWWKLKKGINDIIFTNTFRLALIATLFPLFYIIQASIIAYFFSTEYALYYLGFSILLGIISTKTRTVTQ